MNAIQALQWAQLKVFFADDTEQFTRSEDMIERGGIMRAMLETYFFRDSPAVLPLPAHVMDGTFTEYHLRVYLLRCFFVAFFVISCQYLM